MEEILTNIGLIDSLIKDLTHLRVAAQHPQFDAALEALLEGEEEDIPFRQKDLNDDVILAYVASTYCFDVTDDGILVLCTPKGEPISYWDSLAWVQDPPETK